MRWNPSPLIRALSLRPLSPLTPLAPLAPLMLLAAVPAVHAEARIFLSVEQAQKKIFGNTALKQTPVVLTDAQTEKMRAASSVRQTFRGERIWRTPDGSWFIVDEVLGKHEMITYALVLNPDLSVRQIDVLEYHESYGYEVADASWRQQFVGKTPASAIKLGNDIRNVSGATLSCKHLTDGVKRLMVMADMVLRSHDGK